MNDNRQNQSNTPVVDSVVNEALNAQGRQQQQYKQQAQYNPQQQGTQSGGGGIATVCFLALLGFVIWAVFMH